MSTSSRALALATRAGNANKALRLLLNGNVADLVALTTTEKGNLVGALNELHALIQASTSIDDAQTGTSTTWSSTKIDANITAAIDALVAGAPGVRDTLKELSDAFVENADFITSLQGLVTDNANAAAAAQSTADSAVSAAATADTKATNAASSASSAQTTANAATATADQNALDVTALETAIGDTEADLVAAFDAALAS